MPMIQLICTGPTIILGLTSYILLPHPERHPRSSCPGGAFQGAGVRLGLGLIAAFGGVNVAKGGLM